MLECLELRPEFGLYELLLRDAARTLAGIDDERIGGIRGIEREGRGLVVLAPLVPGQRLEELLEARSADEYAGPGIDAALGFLVQALPAIACLHRAGLVHGTIAPGRIALTPSGQVVLLDCIYADALDRLRLSRQALWSSLAIAAPVTAGGARFDRITDLRQVSLAALAIALGRPLQDAFKPDVVARLLQEVTDVAQIRGGERFAVDVRSLLGAGSGAPADAAVALEQASREAERLASSLGTDTCLAALTELARFQVGGAEPVAHPVLRPARLDAPIVETTSPQGPLEPFEPLSTELSLDLSESVEISFEGLDEPDVLELELPAEDALVVSIAPDSRRGAFDWTPNSASGHDEQSPVRDAADTALAEFDWAPDPPPVPEPERVEAQPIERIDEQAATAVADLTTESTVAAAAEEPETPARWDPPAPPPGIPLYRPPASSPVVPAAIEIAAPTPTPAQVVQPATPPGPAPLPAPPQASSGMKVYAPPPPPMPAPPLPAPLPQPLAFAPTPSPVTVVVAPAAAAPVPATLRLKTEPSAYPGRPRGILTAPDPEDETRGLPFGGRAPGRRSAALPWKIAAAAGVIIAIGAFAGRPYLDGRTDEPGTPPAAASPEPAVVAAAATGGLQIDTQPTGATVLLDGEDVGRTPLKLDAVKPGRHVVTLSTDSATVRRNVRIEAGKVVTLDVPVYSGWVAIYSPIPLHVTESGRSLGTTETTRLMLSPGRHELTFTNRELGYSAKQTVEIVPGEERVLNLEPKGTVSVNALPWAEVWVDGTRMGETPLANLEVPLGTREFVFKHPTFGERRITTVITAKAPPISVDFNRPGTRP